MVVAVAMQNKFHLLIAAAQRALATERSSRTDMGSEDFFDESVQETLPGGKPPVRNKGAAGCIVDLSAALRFKERGAYKKYVAGTKTVSFAKEAYDQKWHQKLLAMIAVVLGTHPWIIEARQARNAGDWEQPEQLSETEPASEEHDASQSDAGSSDGSVLEAPDRENRSESSDGQARETQRQASEAPSSAMLEKLVATLKEHITDLERRNRHLVSDYEKLQSRTTELVGCDDAMRDEMDLRTTAMRVEFDARTAQMQADLDSRTAELQADLDSRTAELQADLDSRTAELRTSEAQLLASNESNVSCKAELVLCKAELVLCKAELERNVVPVAKSAAQAETPASKVRKPLVPRDLNTASPRQATCGGRDSCHNTCIPSRCSVPEAGGSCKTGGGSCNSGPSSGGSSNSDTSSYMFDIPIWGGVSAPLSAAAQHSSARRP